MTSLVRQIGAFAQLGISSIPQRAGESLAVVVSVGLAVGVLLAALSMERGFRATLDGSGADAVVIAQRTGSNSELDSVVPIEQARMLEGAPALASVAGEAAISPEVFTTVDGIRRTTGLRVNLPLRGVGPLAPALRDGFRIVSGRMLAPGSDEIVVGESAAREFSGLEVGSTVAFGATRWRVVGVFSAPRTIYESEVWGDINTVQSRFGRGASLQTIRLRAASADAVQTVLDWIAADPRLRLDARSERAFFAAQSTELSTIILWLGWPLALAIAAGALAGAVNVTYSSMQTRAAEIATLRAIGFNGFPVFVATLLESALLAAVGGLVGVSAGYALFNGMSASTLGSNFSQVVFSFDVTVGAAATGIALALAVGVLGGCAPAWQAARAPILDVHRRA